MPKITPLNAKAFAARANGLWRSSPARQAIRLQQALLADGINPDTTPSARAQVARAWAELEEQKRIMRGHGVPKPVPAVNDPDRKSHRPRALPAPVLLPPDPSA